METRLSLALIGDVELIQFRFDVPVLNWIIDVLVDEPPVVLGARARGGGRVIVQAIQFGKKPIWKRVDPLLKPFCDVSF